MGPKTTWLKRRGKGPEMWQEVSHVRTGAETGVYTTWSRDVKGCQQTAEATRGREGSSVRAFEVLLTP